MTVIHPPVKPDQGPRFATHGYGPDDPIDLDDVALAGLREQLSGRVITQTVATETDAVNALVDMQRANSEAIDPNGARRLVRSLVALGLLRFE